MRIAVLVKQIPAPAEFEMRDGRLVRDGVPLEVNAYCRRANAKAVELAGPRGEVVVFTMGPDAAEDALREMIACGAARGVHLCDAAFAGSDTLATAVALAAAVGREGAFDLVMAGLNSLDSDTGQVPVSVAELLGLPFAAGVRELEVSGRSFTARLETDYGYSTVEGELPAAMSTAERLCAPSKATPEQRAAVDGDRILRLCAADLGVPAESLGAPGSPTSVGPVRVLTATRRRLRAASVAQAVDLLEDLGAFSDDETADEARDADEATAIWSLLDTGHSADPGSGERSPSGQDSTGSGFGGGLPSGQDSTGSGFGGGLPSGQDSTGSGFGGGLPSGQDSTGSGFGERSVWCFFTDTGVGVELLGEAAELAAWVSGSVTAVTSITDEAALAGLGAAGADRLLVIPCAPEPSQQAEALAAAAAQRLPWVLLVEGTRSGRVVASVAAARNGWGLTGDAVGLEVGPDGRLVAWKPAFGGRLQVPIVSRSPVQMATVRPGVLSRRPPRPGAPEPEPELLPAPSPPRLRTVSVARDDADAGELRRARAVVSVGVGVHPEGYPAIDGLRAALGGAALGATRRVTDQGWVPRSRQIGVTGHSVSPRLLVSVGASGRFNYTVGIRNAATILAVDADPEAEIFDQADVGLVGRWQTVLPELTEEFQARRVADLLSLPAPEETRGPRGNRHPGN